MRHIYGQTNVPIIYLTTGVFGGCGTSAGVKLDERQDLQILPTSSIIIACRAVEVSSCLENVNLVTDFYVQPGTTPLNSLFQR